VIFGKLCQVAAALLVASAAASCSGGKCRTDAQCSASEICAEIGPRGQPHVRRCVATCASEADCLTTLGASCLPIADTASGPVAIETRPRAGIINADHTTRGTIKVCRAASEDIR
jgi:hypothetical protein